jgi:hypothetical protein
MTPEHAGLLDRVGGLMRPVAKIRGAHAAGPQEAKQGAGPQDTEPQDAAPAPEAALRERVERLETVVEGLQDALYRQAQHHDEDFEELRRSLHPEEIARALSADARRRGL